MDKMYYIIQDKALYPGLTEPLIINTEENKELSQVLEVSSVLCFLISKDDKVGVASVVKEKTQSPDGRFTHLLCEGFSRFSVKEKLDNLTLHVIMEPEVDDESKEAEALLKTCVGLFNKLTKKVRTIPVEYRQQINLVLDKGGSKNLIADMISSSTCNKIEENHSCIITIDIKDRLSKLVEILVAHISVADMSNKIEEDTKERLEKRSKNNFLLAQRDEINKELGEKDSSSEVEEYEKKITDKKLPEEAHKEAMRELGRAKKMHSSSHEYSLIITYLDWLLELPWNDSTEDRLDIAEARKILEEDHYGLQKPKERILEYLAVKQLKSDGKTPILCFWGNSGTGKTSIGKSIARALDRKFYRMSVGGVRDESDIRGFKRTYVGAMPGRIIQSIKRAGSNNPVIMLDEIDKIGSDHRGDPSSALLEALDPEQNYTFNDHYINVPFDLSKVMFITTANQLRTIQPALRDRMEMIEFTGYTHNEKIKIAEEFLIDKQVEDHGLDKISFHKLSLDKIITGYTRESGVRNLERRIADVCRKVAVEKVETKVENLKVLKSSIETYLGPPKFPDIEDVTIPTYGIALGLYASQSGGGISFIETVSMKMLGKIPQITTSGSLGDIFKESVGIARTWIRANSSNIKGAINAHPQTPFVDTFTEFDIHLHMPEGAVPIDGPSAGVGILTALVSLASGKQVKSFMAMTGEITLRGKVLPVGGIKQKVIGAYRQGVKEIILPKWNEKDLLEDVPSEIRDNIKFHYVESMQEVLKIAL